MKYETIPTVEGTFQRTFTVIPGQAYRFLLNVTGATASADYSLAHYNDNESPIPEIPAKDVTSGEEIAATAAATPLFVEHTVVPVSTQLRFNLSEAPDGGNIVLCLIPM